MLPVVTVEEMRDIDRDAPEPTETLIERAGAATAAAAIRLLGGAYGRRVVILAGTGNNGADGRVAGRRLARRGAHVRVVEAAARPVELPPADLVIDAALGTGITRPYHPPQAGVAPVLAVDIPSGVNGDTGEALGAPLAASVTVTFAALKPGLLLGSGPRRSGRIVLADIGLDCSRATIHVVTDGDASALLPHRPVDTHKWRHAVLVVAGSPGMTGAASLAAEAALRSGAGMVRLATPGVAHAPDVAREVVSLELETSSWAPALVDHRIREHAVAIGPGLGTAMATRHQVRTVVGQLDVPMVVDGDGLTALGTDVADIVARRTAPTVLTPHDGEFERLTGARPGDRIGDVRSLARRSGAVVLLKGPTTVVADPAGAVRIVTAGDDRLATAGSGDVLTGIVVSLLAGGLPALDAASIGAHLHGAAGRLAPRHGAIASDVAAAIPGARSALADDAVEDA